MVVELFHAGHPLTIDVVIGCGSEVRQILGEARSARSIWAPYILGAHTGNGKDVLVQSPNFREDRARRDDRRSRLTSLAAALLSISTDT
jgi:transcriptional regulator of aromatic amino acid metabolism